MPMKGDGGNFKPVFHMKKLFLTLLVAVISFGTSNAQSSLVATLSHEGTTSAFYGAEALGNALDAAQAGDVITLSSGSFAAKNISKGVTIRGAGMSVGENGALPTVLQGGFIINADNITIEGIYHSDATITINGYTNSNVTFIKSRLYTVTYSGGGNAYNNRFIHCKIANNVSSSSNSSLNLLNSVVNQPGGSGLYNISNCVLIYPNNSSVWPSTISNATISNSIVYCATNDSKFRNNVVLSYNLGNGDILWSNSSISSNQTNENLISLFKDFDGVYNDDVTFKLTDAAAAQYVGSDGTQVGLYGGSLPFDPVPTNPQITKAKVAGKSSVDGKLSIELEVNGANH